jgi:glycosyltransferase involved in cell wall biosynthesis
MSTSIDNLNNSSLKMQNPKISIGIPIYNGENYIRLTIESLLEQNFKEFEIIISDNASTDDTAKICREYKEKDNRINYLRQITNIGGITNFKVVLDNAAGKYFMWLAADDILSNKDYLKLLNNEISEEYNYYFPEVSLINSEGKITRSNVMSSFKNCKTQLDFFQVSLDVNNMHLYSLFLKESLIKDWKYLEKCKNLPTCNEGLFVHAINATRKGKFVHKAIKFYRHHQNSWSSRTSPGNLIYSQIVYASRSIQFILTFKNFTNSKKIFFSMRILFLSSKTLLYFILFILWRLFGLYKFPLLKKIISKLRK